MNSSWLQQSHSFLTGQFIHLKLSFNSKPMVLFHTLSTRTDITVTSFTKRQKNPPLPYKNKKKRTSKKHFPKNQKQIHALCKCTKNIPSHTNFQNKKKTKKMTPTTSTNLPNFSKNLKKLTPTHLSHSYNYSAIIYSLIHTNIRESGRQ